MQRYIVGGRENTKFIHDGDDVLADDNGGTLTKYLNGVGIDEKLRVQNGTSISYFLADHLGSTNGLTDTNGSLTASTAYDSFGNATNASFPTRYQFTGREYDSFSGFYYYRARWYDAGVGRFISEDPIGFAGGDSNLYGYVRNNPARTGDPLGLYPWDWSDFVQHYFTGGGRAINLADIGLLGTFQGSASVIGETTGFKSKVIEEAKKRAASECDKNCVVTPKSKRSTYFSLSDRTSTNVTSEPGLFAVGRSSFYRNAVCFVDVHCTNRTLRFKCTLGFSIRDKFTDPLDGERAGFPFNLPGSQPYAINAGWSQDFIGGCKF